MHPSAEVRKKAIFWLGETGHPRALDALIEIIKGNWLKGELGFVANRPPQPQIVLPNRAFPKGEAKAGIVQLDIG